MSAQSTFVVTGAGDGIGRDLCKHLIGKGNAKVIAVSRNAEHLESLRREIASPDLLQTIAVDLSSWAATREKLSDLGQPIDGLVNNAGVAVIKPFEEITEEDFDRTIAVNLRAVFNVSQVLAPQLRDGGRIVNVSSLASTRSFAGHTAYAASKAGVDSLTRSLALELAPRRIRVNSVNPTVILTKMGRANWSDPVKSRPLLNKIPLNRFGEVPEVIEAIMFLLSDASSFVNGESLLLDGGYSVQ